MDFRRPIPLDRFSQYFPPSCQPRRESAIVSATSMRAQSLTLSLALLLAPALAQTPAPQPAQPARRNPPPRPPQPQRPPAHDGPPRHHRAASRRRAERPGPPPRQLGRVQGQSLAQPARPAASSTTASPSNPPRIWTTKRRPELVELFDREIVGRVPANVPAVHWEVVSTTPGSEDGIPTITKRLIGHVDNSAYPAITVNIEVDLILPAAATKPVPAVVEITFDRPLGSAPLPPRPARPAPPAAAAPPPAPAPARSLLAGSSAAPAGPSPSSRPSPRVGPYALLYPTSLPGRRQRRTHLRNHRPLQPRPATQAGRLGRTARLGLGSIAPGRLLSDRPRHRRAPSRRRGPLALRQGRPGHHGLRTALHRRLHQLIRRGRRIARPPPLRRAARKHRRRWRGLLDGWQLY